MARAYHLTKFCVFAGLIFGALYPAAAQALPVCTTESLQAYVGLDMAGGCSIGEFVFLRFSDPTPTTIGNPVVASPSQILVTPVQTATGAGFIFSAPTDEGEGNLFSISSPEGTTAVTYYINYSADPAPVITGASLRGDPFAGNASVTQFYCTSDVLSNGCQFGVPSQQTVTPTSPLSVIAFSNPSNFVDTNMDISLSATPGDPASIDSIEALLDTGAVSPTPEPSVLLLTSCPLLLLFLLRRKRV